MLLACDARDLARVVAEISRLGLDAQLVRNRAALMVLPGGVSKRTGVLHALSHLGSVDYQRGAEFRGYRNGYAPERTVGTGMGALAIRQPRVSNVPAGAEPFTSEIVGRYERRSETQALRRVSALALPAAHRALRVPVRRRPVSQGGLEAEKTAMLIVIGVTADGRKDLLAMEEGYRESTASWAGVLRGLRDRGLLEAPLLAVGDGALGLWGGLNQVFPSTRHRRRWNLRRLNVLDKLPRRLHAETSKQLHALYTALTRAECTQLRAALCQQLRLQGQADAAACLERDWEDFVAFYDFPEEHWTHLRTSNPIEGIFAGVRLRTNAAKRDQKPQPAAPADRRRAIHRRQAATSTEHGGCRRVAHLSGLPWKKFLKT